MLSIEKTPLFDNVVKPRKRIGWTYTWSKKHKGKIYKYSQSILEKDIKLMKNIDLHSWRVLMEEKAEWEINKVCGIGPTPARF